MPVAWVLNLDADSELRDPSGYTTSSATRERIVALASRLLGLLAPGDVLLHDDTTLPGDATRYLGQAWCPTPRALERLRASGARLPPTPALSILRTVNHREFCARLGSDLPDSCFAHDVEAVRAHLATHPPRTWLLKRPFGYSGRGQRRVVEPNLDAATLRWVRAAVSHEGGVLIEPLVQREADFVVHGYVQPDGTRQLGPPTIQVCDARGAWLRTQLANDADLSTGETRRLVQRAEESASALHAAGYFGPFGVDAYRWVDDDGTRHLNARSEINARYTMGWHVGMGDWRPYAMSTGSQ